MDDVALWSARVAFDSGNAVHPFRLIFDVGTEEVRLLCRHGDIVRLRAQLDTALRTVGTMR